MRSDSSNQTGEIRIAYPELVKTLSTILRKFRFSDERAQLAAELFANASRDGVSSHGVNRFPRFIRMIRNGLVEPEAVPNLVSQSGGLERWDGNFGPGMLNAHHSMGRAIELSRKHGIACIALANTNHWMRGGNYGWQAADAGVIGICWTNTMPNLPPWGASDPRLGNNPLIIALPRKQGHVVLDIAMSQFSYGAIESYRRKGAMLPVPGGFNVRGELTRDPAEIEASYRPLPIGYWKGSGLALILDLVAVMLSAGQATHQLAHEPEREAGLSQVFIAIDPAKLGGPAMVEKALESAIADLHQAKTIDGETVRYPGEQVLKTRERNLREGVPVNEEVWQEIIGGSS
jgi:3-dehydro-L-gulonate 2-dehydrogenase